MTVRATPPRGAVRLARTVLDAEDANRLLDALGEEFADQRIRRGSAGAARWFWWQVIRSVPALRRSRRRRQHEIDEPTVGSVNTSGAERRMSLPQALYDLRFAARALARTPSWTVVVVGTLGVGIGATLATFAVFHSLLLAPLPFRDGDRLVRVYNRNIVNGMDRLHFSDPGAVELRNLVKSFASVGLLYGGDASSANLAGSGRPRRVRTLWVNAEYFDALGVVPMAGRGFGRADETAAPMVAVISQELFDRELGGSSSALGGSIRLDDITVSVIGVLRGAPTDPVAGTIDVWLPAPLAGAEGRSWGNNHLSAFARLADGVTIEQARAELELVAANHATMEPDAAEKAFSVVAAREDLVGDVRPLLRAMMAAVLLVLLLTCTNVGSLMLARLSAREQELATRMALGANRRRLAQFLIFDAAIIATGGALAGVLVGSVALRGLLVIAPAALPLRDSVAFGVGPLVAAGLLGALVAMILGLTTVLPVLLRRQGPRLVLSGRATQGRHGTHRLRALLVVADVSLAVMLLVGAGILIRTVSALEHRDLGIDVRQVQSFQVDLPSSRYQSPSARLAFQLGLTQRLAAVPGIEATGAVSHLPVTGSHSTWGTRPVSGTRVGTDADNVQAEQRIVSGQYFDAVGIHLTSGRDFNSSDVATAARVVLVNQAAATTFFGTQDPLGRELLIGPFRATVAGVVSDVAQTARTGPAPTIYHNFEQFGAMLGWPMRQVFRVRQEMPAPWATIRGALATIDPDLAMHDLQHVSETVGAGLADERFASVLLRFFAGLATLIAALGLFALLSHTVTTRRHDIGIRLAVGASAGEVRSMIVRQGLALGMGGTAIGVMLSVGLAGLLDFLVYGIPARDPVTFMLVPALVMFVTLLASWGPAQVATRIDPRTLLNGD